MRLIRPLAALTVAGLLLAACGQAAPDGGPDDAPDAPPADGADADAQEPDAQEPDAPEPDAPESDEPEHDAPAPTLVRDLDPDDAAPLGAAVTAFGFDLHRTLLDEASADATTDGADNLVTSPLSAAVLLAMVAAGAEGETAGQLADVLHLDDHLDARFAALLEQLTATDDVTLTSANALWANEGVALEPGYATTVEEVFDAEVQQVALGDPLTAAAIDDWVEEHTAGMIDELADGLGLPDANAVLVLANAIAFLGEWSVGFDPDSTSEREFTLSDGTVVEVPLMYRASDPEAPVLTASRDGYEVLRLTYGDEGRFGMEVFLPDADNDLPTMLATLDAEEWAAAIAALEERSVDVSLPRFTLEGELQLDGALQALGATRVFGSDAQLAPMTPAAVFLDRVVQATYLEVDEEGTRAAAVTGGIMATSAPPRFTVDRPFALTISDRDTGTVLLLASIEDPRG